MPRPDRTSEVIDASGDDWQIMPQKRLLFSLDVA